VPFIALGIAAGLFTAWVELRFIGADEPAYTLPYINRLLIAGRTPWFYLSKLLWPHPLTFIYERWDVDPRVWWQWLFPVATAGLIVGLWFLRGRSRAPLAAILFFGVTLFPALGFFNIYPFRFSYVADHFQYLASLGIIALFSAAVWTYAGKYRVLASAIVLVALAIVGRNESPDYRYKVALYHSILDDNPKSWMALHNLACAYAEDSKPAEGIEYERRSLEIHPNHCQAHETIGQLLIRTGQTEEGLNHLRTSIELDPSGPRPKYIYGRELYRLKRYPESVEVLKEAQSLAIAQGRPTEAINAVLEKLQVEIK
jgi:tetratricopeptide (TPR) repeat protein